MSSEKLAYMCISVHVVSEHSAGSHLHFYPDSWSCCAAQAESFAVRAGEMLDASGVQPPQRWLQEQHGTTRVTQLLARSRLVFCWRVVWAQRDVYMPQVLTAISPWLRSLIIVHCSSFRSTKGCFLRQCM